jgi:hypothetical protein
MTAADASGNGNDGNCGGGITFEQPGLQMVGVPGDTAAQFDGATGRISIDNSEVLNPMRITMEGLVRWDGQTVDEQQQPLQQRIVEKESFAGTTQYGLSVLPDGHVHVELRRRGGAPTDLMIADSSPTGVVALGAETHVAATYDGLAIEIYLNGELDSSVTVNTSPVDIDIKWPHPPGDPEVALVIGDRMAIFNNTQRTFNGLIDEVAVYAAALSPDRIRAHYEAQVVMATTTEIQVSATDNELYILAVADSGLLSSEVCHIKSGFNNPVAYTVIPQSILPPGKYTLVMVGINWGGPQAFDVTLTTGGVTTTYTAPANPAVGANWTAAVPITV